MKNNNVQQRHVERVLLCSHMTPAPYAAPYGVQRFLTGCRTATGPISGSAVFTLATTDGCCWFSLMDPYVAASVSSVVFIFTASISLHVPVMSCCRSRRTHHDPRPWSHRRGIRVSVRSDLWNKQPYLCRLFKPPFSSRHFVSTSGLKRPISGQIYLISWLFSSMRKSGYSWEYRGHTPQLLSHVRVRGSLLTFSPNLNPQSTPFRDRTPLFASALHGNKE